MNIKSLDNMEKIVKSNWTLSWRGWDVIQSFPNPAGWSKKNGAFMKNRWFVQRRFNVTESGWDLPDKIVSLYEER
jgi:hypothetical protein